ncbi:uncharacterized protein LOC141620693 [Silene latifolia]|uniref:uncharacterized protein LOC141620693 n=1 Tax=Silene latifolia TaxID=37657 RepID=UPI003D778D86
MVRKGTTKDKERISEMVRIFCKRTLWGLPGPQSWKILLWRILTDSLSVGYNFSKRGIEVDSSCKLCKSDLFVMETMEHLFRDCPVSRRLWASSECGIRTSMDSFMRIDHWIIGWISFLKKLEDAEMRLIRFLAMLWCLWSIRNRVLFHDMDFHPIGFFNLWAQIVGTVDQVSIRAQKDTTTEDSNINSSQQESVLWIRDSNPCCLVGEIRQCDVVRVMVDAGWRGKDTAGVGWVTLSPTGEQLMTAEVRITAESPLQAEGLGVRMVIRWAHDHGFRHLMISSDCLGLVCQLAGLHRPHHQIEAVLADIQSFFPFFHCLAISYIPRVLNNVAHSLACKAMTP